MRTLFDAIINDDPLPGENDTNATIVPADQVWPEQFGKARRPVKPVAGTSPSQAADATTELRMFRP